MSKSGMISTYNSNDDKFYDDITDIIKRVSNRTLEMKTNNVKLLNKIAFEMNNLLSKTQDIVKICLNDRSDFISEIENIQFDFIELGKKIDEKFSLGGSNKTRLESTTQFEIGKSTLKTILASSDEEEDDEERAHNEIKSITAQARAPNKDFGMYIPDTCADILNYPTETDSNAPKAIKAAPIQNKGLVIRDTIDTNEFFMDFAEHENKNETVETSEDMDKTRLDNPIVNKKNVNTLHLNRVVSQSTPLAIKKKLQEHGLLDLTCSPQTTQETQLPPQKIPQKEEASKEKPAANKKLNVNSPVKYIQRQFSPLVESPQKGVVLGLTTPTKGGLKTPSKTPAKSREETCRSPSVIGKKAATTAPETNENDAENELDYSFDFREQKRNTQNKKPANSTLKPKNTLENISNNVFMSKSPFKANDDPPSPKRTAQNKPKRFKQLTMAQALSTHADTSSKSSQNSNKTSKTSLAIKSSSSNQLDIDEDFLDETQDVRNQNLRSVFSIKNEPNEPVDNSIKKTNAKKVDDELGPEFFAEFNKVPKKKTNSPTYKHVEVVRKQDERKKLPASSCWECENYWNSIPEDKRPKRMDDTCRHRAKYQAPPTPEHYWSIAFPNTQECIERGYGGVIAKNDNEDNLGRRPRRKRPLKLRETKANDDEIDDFDFGDEK